MRMLAALLAVGLMTGPTVGRDFSGEDYEFAETRSACLDDTVDGDAGSAEGIAQVCHTMEATLAEAKAQGQCWQDDTTSWVRCD